MIWTLIIVIGVAYVVVTALGPTIIGRWVWRRQQGVAIDKYDYELNKPTFYDWWQPMVSLASPKLVISIAVFCGMAAVFSYSGERSFVRHSVPVTASILDSDQPGSASGAGIEFTTIDGKVIHALITYHPTSIEGEKSMPIRYWPGNPRIVKAANDLYPKTSNWVWLSGFLLVAGLYRLYMVRQKSPIKDWRAEI